MHTIKGDKSDRRTTLNNILNNLCKNINETLSLILQFVKYSSSCSEAIFNADKETQSTAIKAEHDL